MEWFPFLEKSFMVTQCLHFQSLAFPFRVEQFLTKNNPLICDLLPIIMFPMCYLHSYQGEGPLKSQTRASLSHDLKKPQAFFFQVKPFFPSSAHQYVYTFSSLEMLARSTSPDNVIMTLFRHFCFHIQHKDAQAPSENSIE